MSGLPCLPVTLAFPEDGCRELGPADPRGINRVPGEGRPGSRTLPAQRPWPNLGKGSRLLRPGLCQPLKQINVPIAADSRMRTPRRPLPAATAPGPPGVALLVRTPRAGEAAGSVPSVVWGLGAPCRLQNPLRLRMGEAAGPSSLLGQTGGASSSLCPSPLPFLPPSRPFLGREALAQNPGPGGSAQRRMRPQPPSQRHQGVPVVQKAEATQGLRGRGEARPPALDRPRPLCSCPEGPCSWTALPTALPVAVEGPERSPAQRTLAMAGAGLAGWGPGHGRQGSVETGVSQPATQTVLRGSVGTTLGL